MIRNRTQGRITRAVALTLSLGLAACGGGGGDESNDAPPPAEPAAFVGTTDFSTGSFATLPLDAPGSATVNRGTLHSDATVRSQRGLIYVMNRAGADNIQVIDPSNDFSTVIQCSVGGGANPHDIQVVAANKAYVSRYDMSSIAIVDPTVDPTCAGFVTGEIDLSGLADADGLPEMDQMVVVGDRLFVALQRLDRNDFFNPTETSLLAVIDIENDTLVDVDPSTPEPDAIVLTATNPFAESKGLTIDATTGNILVVETGDFGVMDGGIDMVDPENLQALGLMVTEAQLGGDLTDFALVDGSTAYAVVSDENFTSSVVRFDPSTGAVSATLLVGSSFIPDIEYESVRGHLYVADQDFNGPGVRVFDAGNAEITAAPVDTGLPPFNIVFVQ